MENVRKNCYNPGIEGRVIRLKAKTHPFRSDEGGATAIEFAIVSGVFFMLVFGILEFGLIMYTRAAIDGITYAASREVGVGGYKVGCATPVDCIKKYVQQKSQSLINPESVRVTSSVVTDPSTPTPAVPDICLDNTADPYPPTCVKREENNGVPGYQPGSLNVGTGGQLVEVRVTYLWRVMFPIFRSKFGQNGVLTITAATVVQNEPL